MEIHELSHKMLIKNELRFPVIYTKPEVVMYKLGEKPQHGSKYLFELYEYDQNGNPVKRSKTTRNWIQNQTVGFDMRKDFYCKEGVKYCLKIKIKTHEGSEISDVVYISL